MDLSSPLRSIAPGLDSAVLQVLAGTDAALGADWEQQLQDLEDQVLAWTGNRLDGRQTPDRRKRDG